MLIIRVFGFKNNVFNIPVFGGITKFQNRKNYIVKRLFGSRVVRSIEILPMLKMKRKTYMIFKIPLPIFSQRYFSRIKRSFFLKNIAKNWQWNFKNHVSLS